MRQALRLALVVSLVGGGLFGLTHSSSAASCIRIYRIYYNSPGSDTGSNKSLNAEWIQLKNRCGTARWLSDWKINDAAGNQYVFGRFKLAGGKSVKLHTGKGTNTSTDRYWGRSRYVWNNDKDTAYLYDRYGFRVDTCSYNNRSSSSVYC